MIIIKRVEIDNLKDIQMLNNKLFEHEYKLFDLDLIVDWPFGEDGTNYFINMINNSFVYVAIAQDKVVGYLAGIINDKDSYVTVQTAEIDNMYVEEEFRGQNIGTMLIGGKY